jgi:hypothetical protein
MNINLTFQLDEILAYDIVLYDDNNISKGNTAKGFRAINR